MAIGWQQLAHRLADRVIAPARILLVDANPAFREASARYLVRDPRIRVVWRSCSGRAATRLVAALNPDLVLIASDLPGMDGLQTARAIKSLPNAPFVILMTLFERQSHQVTADDDYVDAFITKEQLISELNRFVDAWFGMVSRLIPARVEEPMPVSPMAIQL